MFSKVLVANRGEIAVRIIRTLSEMGIASVAVYSDADADALHVRMADEAYGLGPAPSDQSYLLGDAIVEVCKQSGAAAVHPGYGFLSENAEFVRKCEAASITFIGPSAEAMIAMGEKTSARQRMIDAGVPVVPGVNAGSLRELSAAAQTLGFPVMLKAAAGGGGKGMRLVHDPADLEEALSRAKSEAMNAFGDDTVYLEKAIVRPRHVEIQVLADTHGNCVHLFERDCSVQRRHQKVIEESPSPAPLADDALVEKMGEVAIRAAKAVDYASAGTVEFLLDEKGEFYFLEMNTRLQVEHPITELVTGIDLVREQVRVAAGERLGYEQKDVKRNGHAIECRVYAEDPQAGFMPSPGKIAVLRTASGPFVRDDSCAFEGTTISRFYDPLVSKLSVWGKTRDEAISRMRRALTEYVIAGIKTNVEFHLRVLSTEAFQSGLYDTGFIAEHPELLSACKLSETEHDIMSVAAALHVAWENQSAHAPSSTPAATRGVSAWRLSGLIRR